MFNSCNSYVSLPEGNSTIFAIFPIARLTWMQQSSLEADEVSQEAFCHSAGQVDQGSTCYAHQSQHNSISQQIRQITRLHVKYATPPIWISRSIQNWIQVPVWDHCSSFDCSTSGVKVGASSRGGAVAESAVGPVPPKVGCSIEWLS